MYKAKKDFILNGVFYEKGNEVKVKSLEELIKINEKGFIEPLTIKDYQNFGKEIPKKIIKKEEE